MIVISIFASLRYHFWALKGKLCGYYLTEKCVPVKNFPLRKVTFETGRKYHCQILFLLTIQACNLSKHEFMNFGNEIQFPTALFQDLLHLVFPDTTADLIGSYPRPRFNNSVRMLLQYFLTLKIEARFKKARKWGISYSNWVSFTAFQGDKLFWFLFVFSITYSRGRTWNSFSPSNETGAWVGKNYLSLIGKRQYTSLYLC